MTTERTVTYPRYVPEEWTPKNVISWNLIKKARQQETTPDADEATKQPSLFLPSAQGLSEIIQIAYRKLDNLKIRWKPEECID